jgi:hypothetical protein
MPKKGKKSTPPELDFIFDRELIEEDDYRDFWGRWGKANKREREDIINSYLEEEAEQDSEEPLTGIVTKNRLLARNQAEIIGGYVARRNKSGRFSKRGHFYQAIRRRRK